MFLRTTILVDEEAKKYKIKSVSCHKRRPNLYFATMVATGHPTIMVKLKYVKKEYHEDFYSVGIVREGNNEVVNIAPSVLMILSNKVQDLLENSKSIDFEAIRKLEEERCQREQHKSMCE